MSDNGVLFDKLSAGYKTLVEHPTPNGRVFVDLTENELARLMDLVEVEEI